MGRLVLIIEIPFFETSERKGSILFRRSYRAPVNIEPAGRRVMYLSCQYAYAVKKKGEEKRKKTRAQ